MSTPELARKATKLRFVEVAVEFSSIMNLIPNADYDGAWKEILNRYLPEVIDVLFPEVAKVIDWSKPIRNLNKELQNTFSISCLQVIRFGQTLGRNEGACKSSDHCYYGACPSS